MSQKTIWSFFKPKNEGTVAEENSKESSPLKKKMYDKNKDDQPSKKFKKDSTPLKSKEKLKAITIKNENISPKTLENQKKQENSFLKDESPKKNEDGLVKNEVEVIQKEGPPIKDKDSPVKKEEFSIKKNEESSEKKKKSEEKRETSIKTVATPIKKEDSSIKNEQKNSPIKRDDSLKTSEESPKATANKIVNGFFNEKQSNQDIGLNYNPAKIDYHPIEDAFWKENEKTPYLALARTFQLIEETRGRLKMMKILSNFFTSVILLSPKDLLSCVYLSINQLAPAYEGIEIGVAETFIMKIICKTTGRDMKHIKTQAQTTGDLGIVAELSRVSQQRIGSFTALTVENVFEKLKKISQSSGQQKTNFIQSIFVACRHSEARFFVRSLIGKLRIGIAEQSLLYSLATAIVNTKLIKENRKVKLHKIPEATMKNDVDAAALILRTSFCQCPNYNKIIPTLLEYGMDHLSERCPMEPGLPIKPMLAQPTKSINEILERLDGSLLTCEWKYDGERAQIHQDDKGNVSIFSRNQENNTTKYPDVISRIDRFKKATVKSYIIDSEIVAWDVKQKLILPFQILSTRKRKNVEINDIKVQVCAYVFDLLYLNGKPLVTLPFIERRKLLKENFTEYEGDWKFATSSDTNSIEEVQQFLDESIKGNCEGLMIKTLEDNATYEIAKRSHSWLKLKKDYVAGVGDSLDLVVIGGYKGKGKRTGIYGGFLLACYDHENEEFQTICKIGTGFSDEDLRVHANFFQQHIIEQPKSYFCYDDGLKPDEWFEPIQVWEVKCADFSLSPVHKAAIGIVDSAKGISLRFPRFIRIRDDKTIESSTDVRQIAAMYNSQNQIKSQTNDANDDFDDFY